MCLFLFVGSDRPIPLRGPGGVLVRRFSHQRAPQPLLSFKHIYSVTDGECACFLMGETDSREHMGPTLRQTAYVALSSVRTGWLVTEIAEVAFSRPRPIAIERLAEDLSLYQAELPSPRPVYTIERV